MRFPMLGKGTACASNSSRCLALPAIRTVAFPMALTCGDLIKRGRDALRRADPRLLFEDRQIHVCGAGGADVPAGERAARQAGSARQERVAILARNCSEYIESFGACEVAGFVAINLNSRLAEAELAAICQDSQPSVADLRQGVRRDSEDVLQLRCRASGSGSESSSEIAGDLNYEDLIARSCADEPRAKVCRQRRRRT